MGRMKAQTVKFLLALAFLAAALVLLAAYFWLIRPAVGEDIGDRAGWIAGIYIPAAVCTLAGAGLLVHFAVTALRARRKDKDNGKDK